LCESNVYIRDDEGEKLVMEDAVLVENEGGIIKVTDILGDEKEFKGSLEEVTFLEHRIVIRK
jgi:predicted RNA-binding protein